MLRSKGKAPTLSRVVDALFLLGLLVFLLLGLVQTVFLPKDINYYENRSANTIGALSEQTVADGTFQTSLEDALADQVPWAQTMKSKFNLVSGSFQVDATEDFVDTHSGCYIQVLGTNTFNGDHLVYMPRDLSLIKDKLDARAENLNAEFALNPGLDFYVYYIEKDTDINFETGEKVGAREYLERQLTLPPAQIGQFAVDDFDTFDRCFYLTDHHWNCFGSYQGYKDVMALLSPDSRLIPPEGAAVPLGTFSGSKANSAGASGVFTEPFYAYRYTYPDFDVSINGEQADDYRNQDAFLGGTSDMQISYASFYGSDMGEIVFDAHQPECKNLLVVGESYDNAILKLLASHYDRTYSVDLRHYAELNGKFHLKEYVRQHDISDVLIIGNIDFFVMDEFILED